MKTRRSASRRKKKSRDSRPAAPLSPVEALPRLKAALEADLKRPSRWFDYAEALLALAQPAPVFEMLAVAEQHRLLDASALRRLRDAAAACQAEVEGVLALHQGGDPAAVVPVALRFTSRWPRAPLGWSVLGAAYLALGRWDEAVAALRHPLRIDPASAEHRVNLAAALVSAGLPEEAEGQLVGALERDPGHLQALNDLAYHRMQRGRLDEAAELCDRAIAADPGFLAVQVTRGDLLRAQGRAEEAERIYRQVLAGDPGHYAALSNLGVLLADARRFAEAEACYRRAIAVQPRDGRGYANLGSLLRDLGDLTAAAECFREACARDPGRPELRSNLLFCLDGGALGDAASRLAEAVRFGEAVAERATPFTDWPGSREADRPLHVGFVSGDLRDHSVGLFLETILPELARRPLILHAYPTARCDDAVAERLRANFAAWTPLDGLPDPAAARRIRDDGIDLLIDLSGHTAHNRLGVFAWKPAPVQASWLGYSATTGVKAVDWYLTDAVRVPPEHEAEYVERVFCLPHTRVCFSPPQEAPPVAPLPAERNGYVTFGSFQPLHKVSDAVLRAWGEVLRRSPGARLRFQCKPFADEAVRTQFRRRLDDLGLVAERFDLLPPVARAAYLAAYGEVDLLLDTFPYPGGTTTCQALWMGVPTVTRIGATETSRNGASQLICAGLTEWVAHGEGEYVEKALRFAADLPALAALRAGLREQAARSPLFDAPRFAADFEAALRTMWRDYCGGS
ncbi:O-linked N-acetylglucosamine transferase family protein [Endothiovibrio diazotrophicus]